MLMLLVKRSHFETTGFGKGHVELGSHRLEQSQVSLSKKGQWRLEGQPAAPVSAYLFSPGTSKDKASVLIPGRKLKIP